MLDTIPEIDCDVVVIGGGIAGLSAAITAMREGAEVISIEKAPKLQRGGNSAIADAQIRYPHEPDEYCPTGQTKEDFFNAFMKVSRGRANKELIRVPWIMQRTLSTGSPNSVCSGRKVTPTSRATDGNRWVVAGN